MNSTPKPASGPTQEFSIRVPKNTKKRHNVMRFTSTLNVDFTKWSQVKMERENNLREYKGMDEDTPKFGAGSEFGRDAREEARKKKYGIISRKYKPEDQPWILKAGGKTGKKFRGIKEGGISQYASYYIFTHAQDGAIEAFPLNEWYNFQPIQRYKTLSAEEAEAEFAHRNSVMNYFSLMIRKKLKNDEEGEEDEELKEDGKGKKGNKKSKDLKISDMEEWMQSDDDSSDSEGGEEKKNSDDEEGKKNNKNTKAGDKKKKKKKNKKKDDFEDDDHAFEESDDGDEEGRECDYMSESSESGSDLEKQKEIKSVAEEDALRKLLVSDEEDEDEDEKNNKDEDEDKNEDDDNKETEKENDKLGKEGEKRKDKKKKKKKSIQKKDTKKSTGKDSSSDFSSESDSDSDVPKEKEKDKKTNSAHSSRSTTPTPAASTSEMLKRKINASPDLSQPKKMKIDNFSSVPTPFTPSSSESGITEEAVRRYLMRKPMTTTELLQKFKSKKTGLTSEQLVNTMTGILKRINPTKQTIKSKMYLFIKSQPN